MEFITANDAKHGRNYHEIAWMTDTLHQNHNKYWYIFVNMNYWRSWLSLISLPRPGQLWPETARCSRWPATSRSFKWPSIGYTRGDPKPGSQQEESATNLFLTEGDITLASIAPNVYSSTLISLALGGQYHMGFGVPSVPQSLTFTSSTASSFHVFNSCWLSYQWPSPLL